MKKDKHKVIHNELYIGVYEYLLHINISNNIIKERNKFHKKLNGKLSKKENIDGLHSYKIKYSMTSYIFLDHKVSNGTIAHEAFHATLYIMKSIGSKLNNSSEETFAYLLGHIVDSIYSSLIEYDKLSI